MTKGRYCGKHDEYAHDGICRWCEPATQVVDVDFVYEKNIGSPPDDNGWRELMEKDKNPYLQPLTVESALNVTMPAAAPRRPDRGNMVPCSCGEVIFDTKQFLNRCLEWVFHGKIHGPFTCIPTHEKEAVSKEP